MRKIILATVFMGFGLMIVRAQTADAGDDNQSWNDLPITVPFNKQFDLTHTL